jgi:hypothetical protein
MRKLVGTAILLWLLVITAAVRAATADPVHGDCQSYAQTNRVYTMQAIGGGQATMPASIREHTNCTAVIRSALAAAELCSSPDNACLYLRYRGQFATPLVRPNRIKVSRPNFDGYLAVIGITWHGWGTERAVGYGTYGINLHNGRGYRQDRAVLVADRLRKLPSCPLRDPGSGRPTYFYKGLYITTPGHPGILPSPDFGARHPSNDWVIAPIQQC